MGDPTAVVGRRILAYIMDALIVGAVAFIMFATQAEFVELVPDGFCDQIEAQVAVCAQSDDQAWFIEEGSTVAAVVGVSVGAAILYLVILQGITGATLGKLVAGIRVVKADGTPPGIGRAFVRWVLLVVVDWFPYLLPIVGFVTSLATRGHQRVGDLVAKTYVVRQDAAGRPLSGSGTSRIPDPAWPSTPGTPGGSSFPPSMNPPVSPSPGPWMPPPPPPPTAGTSRNRSE